MKLFNADEVEVLKGDIVKDSDGEEFQVEGWTTPHKPSSTGRVYGQWVEAPGTEVEYFPSVFGLQFKDDSEKVTDPQTPTATLPEMQEHCRVYPCSTCPISYKCTMFFKLFGYMPRR